MPIKIGMVSLDAPRIWWIPKECFINSEKEDTNW